jgi:tRNA(fMet)-specific endonuclease VapC
MKQVLIDTDILSLFFKGNDNVKFHFENYLKEYNIINFSIITYYEILSGLKHKDANKQLDLFLQFADNNCIFPLTESSVLISSDIYSDCRKDGKPIDDIDILIAGIAIDNNCVLITHNTGHFERIKNLELSDWTI